MTKDKLWLYKTWEEKNAFEKYQLLLFEAGKKFSVFMRIEGELKEVYFNNKEEFHRSFIHIYAERWHFYKKIRELIETREALCRYGDVGYYDEKKTDELLEIVKELENHYEYLGLKALEYCGQESVDSYDLEKYLPTKKDKNIRADSNFKFGKISNGDSGIHWQSVGEAFEWVCHICGDETERKGGTHLVRQGCTVDHVVPQSKGGANTWNNVRPAHWECNIKKNALI